MYPNNSPNEIKFVVNDDTQGQSGPVVYVGKEYRPTLFSAQYVKKLFSNGVCGDLLRVTDSFRCRRCELSEDLMVDGETYGGAGFIIKKGFDVRKSKTRWKMFAL